MHFTLSDNELTLKEFIDINHKLLTVVSVFGALTGIFLSPSTYEKNPSISFFTFTMFLLICIELISSNNMMGFISFDNNPINKNPSKLLKIFSLCFIIFVLVIVNKILSDYQSIVSPIVRLAGAFFYIYISKEVINHFDVFKPIRNNGLVFGIICVIIFYLSIIFGVYTF